MRTLGWIVGLLDWQADKLGEWAVADRDRPGEDRRVSTARAILVALGLFLIFFEAPIALLILGCAAVAVFQCH